MINEDNGEALPVTACNGVEKDSRGTKNGQLRHVGSQKAKESRW